MASVLLHGAILGLALGWAALRPDVLATPAAPAPRPDAHTDLTPFSDDGAPPGTIFMEMAPSLPIGTPPEEPAPAPAGVVGGPVLVGPTVARDDLDDPAPDRGAPSPGAATPPAPGGAGTTLVLGGGTPTPSAADALALLDEADLGDAVAGLSGTGSGSHTGPGEGIGSGAGTGIGDGPGGASGPGGTGTSVDLFPGEVLRGIVAAGIPRGEAAEIKAMLDRYVATFKAYSLVKAGLAPPYANHLGVALGDAWEEEILPAKERTLAAGLKRWFGDLKSAPLRSVRDVLTAFASAAAGAGPMLDRPDSAKIDTSMAAVADAWEVGRPRGLALVGVRADGTVVGVKWLRSTGTYAFDDALRDAVVATVAKAGPPPADLVRLTGEAWMLYEVTAAITVLPPGPYFAVRTMADFSEPEALHPFKILVNAKAELRGVFDRGEDYDPTLPPEGSVAAPSAR